MERAREEIMTNSPEQVLEYLLISLFSAEELRKYVLLGPEGDDISCHLPAAEVSIQDLARRVVLELLQRGLIDRALFVRLEGARPDQYHRIRPVRDLLLAGDETMLGTLDLPLPEPSPLAPAEGSRIFRGTSTLYPSPTATVSDFDDMATAAFGIGDARLSPGMASRERNPYLVVRGGFDYLRSVPIRLGVRCRIGRGDGCDLTLTDPSCSRAHAEVTRAPDGLLIRDLKSTVGTWVNGQVLKESPRPIHPGDRILVGNTVLGLEILEDDGDGLERVLAQLKRFLPRMSEALKEGFNPDAALGPTFNTVPHGVVLFHIDRQEEIEAQADRYRRPVFESVRAAVIKTALLKLPERSYFFQPGPDILLVLLPETHEERVAYHVEILRRAVEEYPWACFSHSLKVTVSGVFSRPVLPPDVWPWLEAARAEMARLQRAHVENRFVEAGQGR